MPVGHSGTNGTNLSVKRGFKNSQALCGINEKISLNAARFLIVLTWHWFANRFPVNKNPFTPSGIQHLSTCTTQSHRTSSELCGMSGLIGYRET